MTKLLSWTIPVLFTFGLAPLAAQAAPPRPAHAEAGHRADALRRIDEIVALLERGELSDADRDKVLAELKHLRAHIAAAGEAKGPAGGAAEVIQDPDSGTPVNDEKRAAAEAKRSADEAAKFGSIVRDEDLTRRLLDAKRAADEAAEIDMEVAQKRHAEDHAKVLKLLQDKVASGDMNEEQIAKLKDKIARLEQQNQEHASGQKAAAERAFTKAWRFKSDNDGADADGGADTKAWFQQHEEFQKMFHDQMDAEKKQMAEWKEQMVKAQYDSDRAAKAWQEMARANKNWAASGEGQGGWQTFTRRAGSAEGGDGELHEAVQELRNEMAEIRRLIESIRARAQSKAGSSGDSSGSGSTSGGSGGGAGGAASAVR